MQAETQQQQEQQQPVYGYPNTLLTPPTVTVTHSNGSFGAVFIVLAVIIVISGIACCLGRFCSKKKSYRNDKVKVKPFKEKHKKGHQAERDIDLEFGFDKKIAAGKPAGLRNELHGSQPPPPPGRGFRMPGNEDFNIDERGEQLPPGRGFRMPGNGDFKIDERGEQMAPNRSFRMSGNEDFRIDERSKQLPPNRSFKMSGNGDFRVEPKYPGGDIEFKPGTMHMNMRG
ncbi:hypothetical protein ACFE04_025156 [Oxalis oulophora]